MPNGVCWSFLQFAPKQCDKSFPYTFQDPNTASLTEPEGQVLGPMMGFIRRSRSAYADYIQQAAASFRNMVYKPFQMMGINRHNLR